MFQDSITPAPQRTPTFVGFDTYNNRPAVMLEGAYGKFWLPLQLGHKFMRVVGVANAPQGSMTPSQRKTMTAFISPATPAETQALINDQSIPF